MDCSQCGARLAVPRGASAAQCAHCRGRGRVERHVAAGGRTRPAEPRGFLEAGYPIVHGKKRALLVGINYTGTKDKLHGPINDVDGMNTLLTRKYGFPRDSILILTDKARSSPCRRPTKSNILLAMRWLVHGCSSGDSLVFFFSGHGCQLKDDDGDEAVDRKDEAICPVDFRRNGDIRDDKINEIIVRPLPHGVRLHAIIDACRSGTVLDLNYLWQKNKQNGKLQWIDQNARTGAWKNTSGGHAVLLSACAEDDDSIDDHGDEDTLAMGVLTYSFIETAWAAHRPLTYGQLLSKIKENIAAYNSGGLSHSKLPAAVASHVRKVVNFSGAQEPQLSSSSKDLNINHTPFML